MSDEVAVLEELLKKAQAKAAEAAAPPATPETPADPTPTPEPATEGAVRPLMSTEELNALSREEAIERMDEVDAALEAGH